MVDTRLLAIYTMLVMWTSRNRFGREELLKMGFLKDFNDECVGCTIDPSVITLDWSFERDLVSINLPQCCKPEMIDPN